MKVLVCGGRDYKDEQAVHRRLMQLPTGSAVVTGGQVSKNFLTQELYGADFLAEQAALRLGFKVITMKADWGRYGYAAGPIRNRQMMEEERPDLVIAFPGGRGTLDMMEVAEKAGVPIELAGRWLAAPTKWFSLIEKIREAENAYE